MSGASRSNPKRALPFDLRGDIQPVQPLTDQMKLVSSAQSRLRRNLLLRRVGGELSEGEMAGRWANA